MTAFLLFIALSAPPQAHYVPGCALSYQSTLDYWSDIYNVQRWLPRRMAQVESDFNPLCISTRGAKGLMQTNPRYEAEFMREAQITSFNWKDAGQSIRLGVSHFAHLLRQCHGDYLLAVASYNAGYARIRSAKPIPVETIRYLGRVFG